ncbi:MAG: hypothetical protein IT328_08055 [Caldilineaceae bacterium]|nr:hypothetical protein [Caldilineaceae bacterium]
MLRKALLSITVALLTLMLLVMGVMAQSDEATGSPAFTVVPSVAAASVTQTVPVTLTLSLPSPAGPITVEVPIFLSLDIRIGISPELTTTVEVTPSVVTEVDVIEAEATATEESVVTVPTVASPTAVATSTPTDEPPAATPTPEAVEPTPEPLPTATPLPTETPEPVVVAPLCPDPRSVITSPGVNQVLSGTAQILGTATHENFQYYKVEYAQGADIDPNNTFAYLADARVQVIGGLLATFDSSNLSNGAYTIKLTVVDTSGNFPPPCTVTVVIEN